MALVYFGKKVKKNRKKVKKKEILGCAVFVPKIGRNPD
jgi:hypothetical protein